MSKTEKVEKVKVVKAYETEPLLKDLDFVNLVTEYSKYDRKKSDAETEVKRWRTKRDYVGAEIQSAIESVAADTVTLDTERREYRATIVKGEPGTATSEDKLRLNLMKIAKLDIEMVEKVWAASQIPVDAKKSYVKVTVHE